MFDIDKDKTKLWIIGEIGDLRNTKSTIKVKDKNKREELIVEHYRKHYETVYFVEDLPIKLVSRDTPENPIDFIFESASGYKLGIEVVSISDIDSGYLKQGMREFIENELKAKNVKHSTLAIFPHDTNPKGIKEMLKKIDDNPILDLSDEKAFDDLIQDTKISKKPTVRKLNNLNAKRIIITDGQKTPLCQIVTDAIHAKEKKPYKDLDKKVLLIDDQTISYKTEDFNAVSVPLIKEHANSTFDDIFIYQGKLVTKEGAYIVVFMPIKCEKDLRVALLKANY